MEILTFSLKNKNIFLLMVFAVLLFAARSYAFSLTAPEFIAGDSANAVWGDMNGDGVDDQVRRGTNRLQDDFLTVTIRSDDGWHVLPPVPVGAEVNGLVLADMDGDGDLDVVISYWEDSTSYGLQVFTNDGSGTLLPQAKVEGWGFSELVSADFNGDGNQDVAGVHFSSLGKGVSVVYGDGAGSFSGSLAVFNGDDYSIYNYRGGLATADLDDNGYPDLVAADAEDKEVYLALNNGGGSWQPPAVISSASKYNRGLVVADFNGDNWPEVVFVGYYFNGSYNESWIYLIANNGDGSFAAPVQVQRLGSSAYLIAGQLDGDGILDLVGVSGDNLFFMTGNGDDTFAAPVWYAGSHTYPRSITDINRDGCMDVATSRAVWYGTNDAGDYSFTVSPASVTVNLDEKQEFDYLILNGETQSLLSYRVEFAADAGFFGRPASSDWNIYHAPGSMTPDGRAVVTATRFQSTETATAEVAFTDISFAPISALSGYTVSDLVFEPDARPVLYAATGSGVRISQDGGQTFSVLGTGLEMTVKSLVRTEDSLGNPVLLASTGSGIYRYELDQGQAAAWVKTDCPLAFGTIVLAAQGAVVYAGKRNYNHQEGQYLYKSMDGGHTWTALGLTSLGIVKIWLVDAEHLYVSHNQGLVYSTDGGVTWEERGSYLNSFSFGNISALYIDPHDSDHLLAGLSEAKIRRTGLFCSRDGGLTWQLLADPGVTRVDTLAADPSNPETIYLAGGDAGAPVWKGVWKSTDGGRSWFSLNRGLPTSGSWYCTRIKVSPPDHETVFAVLNTGLYTTRPAVSFTSASQSVTENAGTVTVGLQLSGSSRHEITVPIVLSGTATYGSDYTVAAAEVVFPAGLREAAFTITLESGNIDEPAETIVATLGTAALAAPGLVTSHTITILPVNYDFDGDGDVDGLDLATCAAKLAAGVSGLSPEKFASLFGR